MSTPALTNPIVASVVTVEDCTIKVNIMREFMALIGEPVNFAIQRRKGSPAISFKLSFFIKD